MKFLDFFKKKKIIQRPNLKNVISKISSRELVVSVYKEKIEWLIKRQSILGDREIISAYVKSNRNDFDYAENAIKNDYDVDSIDEIIRKRNGK